MVAKNNAFTLFELIIVVVILATIAVIGVMRIGAAVETGRKAAAFSVLSSIVGDENGYFIETGGYTTTISDLSNFTAAPYSPDFTFSVPSADSSTGYAQAARLNASGGRKSYSMCLRSATTRTCDAATCAPAPACPN